MGEIPQNLVGLRGVRLWLSGIHVCDGSNKHPVVFYTDSRKAREDWLFEQARRKALRLNIAKDSYGLSPLSLLSKTLQITATLSSTRLHTAPMAWSIGLK